MLFRCCFHKEDFERDPLFLELVKNLHGAARWVIVNTLHGIYGVAREVILRTAENYRR